MTSELIQILVFILFGFVVLILFLNHKLSSAKTSSGNDIALLEWLKTTQNDLKNLQSTLTNTLVQSDKNVTDTLQKSYQELNHRLENTTKVIGELKQETGKFSEIGRSMQALQDFLNAPKLRGNLGEQILEDLLAQVLPAKTFTSQYRFQSGETVDVVIKTHAGLIPVDAKFPMENYSKMNQVETKQDQTSYRKLFISDVKKHLKTIAEKYIKTGEKTVDFALMYVPAESVYYEITVNCPELDQVARDLRVLTVSPSTFYAFLRTILVSFEGQRIQAEAGAILSNLRSIQKDAAEFNDKLGILGRHITNAYNNMNGVSQDFNRLQTKIDFTKQIGAGLNDVKSITNDE